MKRKKWIIFGFISVLLLFLFPAGKSFAEVADGTYSIDYEIIHAETESASIANDYFEKPAVLFVKDGKKYVRFTVNHSTWIQTIETPDGEGDDYSHVEIKSEDSEEDIRDVVFELHAEDLNEPMLFKMHVVIDEIEPQIDSHYTARFAFEPDTMEPLEESDFEESDLVFEGPTPPGSEEQAEEEAQPETDTNNQQSDEETDSEVQNEQPVTSSTNVWLIGIIVLIIAAGAVFMLARRKRK